MQEQFQTSGAFSTPNALKYVTQLCKHFGHKVPAEIQGNAGTVTFDMGIAQLNADDAVITATLTAGNAEALAQLQQVIDSHLQRFAFREDFTGMNWSSAQAA